MNRIFVLTAIIITIAWVISLPAVAQSANSGKEIVERIENSSGGNVSIKIPDNILQYMMREDVQQPQQPNLRPGINKLSGFRIQVFSDGSNQRGLEARAKARGNAIAARFPKYRGQVYTFSSSPNWYARIGNFRTQAEASEALTELRRAFPQYANEMRVVKSQIIIIK